VTKKINIFHEIVSRRIPHIIGMYIAAVWLSVEIADWMSDRFNVSGMFSSYVFVGMLTFIPSIIMLAWGHGRPGRDQWSKVEVLWIPINIVLSVVAINMLVVRQNVNTSNNANVNPIVSSPAINLSTSVEFATNNYHNIISFFWENNSNDKSLDWLSYGSSWLFSQDIKRTPNISIITPYDSKNIISELKTKGFDRAVNAPMSLALQVAEKKSQKWMVLGSFGYVENGSTDIKFEAKLYNVKSGAIERELTSTDNNILHALDRISNEMGQYILKTNNDEINIIPDLAIEDHTSNNLEAIKKLISAKNHIAFENDYKAAIEDILQALELDKSFAEANLLATTYYRAQGDFENAIKQSKKALVLDYKIYKESVYALKANLFDMSGEQNKALIVLENWAKVFPTSTIAHATLANKYLFSNDNLDKAELQFEKLLALDSDNHKSLITLGKIYRVQGEKDKTIDVLEKYLAANPEKIEAYLELANAYKQFSMFEQAIKMYEQASILGSQNFEAEIGLVNTTAIQGDYALALEQLSELLTPNNTDRQNLNLLNAKAVIFMHTGQIKKALETLDLMRDPAKNVLSPLNYIFSMDGSTVQMLILQGKYEKALEYTKVLKKNTKPPFNDMVSIFNILIYLSMENQEMFKQELYFFESFLESFPMPVYKSFIIAWKAKLTYWNGDLEKSIQQLDQAILESKQSINGLQLFNLVDRFYYSKALMFFELNKNDEALKELEYILFRNPVFAKAHYLRAKIYQQQNKIKDAELSIQKAMNIWKDADPDFVDLQNLNKL